MTMRRNSFNLQQQQVGGGANDQLLSATSDDETQKDGWDYVHHVMTQLALKGQYFETLRPSHCLVLDYGTGTGIWAIEVANQIYRDGGKVVGFGAPNLRPTSIPTNLEFLEEGRADLWGRKDRFDLIHTRVLPGDKRDWPGFFKEAFGHLKSGCCLEIEALNLELLCDYDRPTLNRNLLLKNLNREDTDNGKQDLDFGRTKELLKGAGFVNVKEDIVTLPISPWSEDYRNWWLGHRFNICVEFFLRTGQYAPPGMDPHPSDLKEIYELHNRYYCRLHLDRRENRETENLGK
ncbi:Putative S-adenosyl-L-methionine-dependent methyltransferase superfamily [Colletotrichum destructivum]|uniref:S-adenosyl-L-methionine-dependent methyltransferase superfamily n=1 Tax=Colletotrichum destructivum TaxID=34406 RepID=A0AAX4I185_9PEZI|nr:Putative S-adenosyl-L-methionine-dependent methyltransferase superfamily [Colletotrichum destructivum]